MLLVAAAVPGLYWDQPASTADAVKNAGVECVHVPAARVAEWKQAGVCVKEIDLAAYERVATPGVQYKMNLASATRSPWVTTNAWRYARKAAKPVLYEAAAGQAALCAVEAFVYGVEAVVRIEPADLEKFGAALAFLGKGEATAWPEMANIGYQDDGSFLSSEYMNLMSRRNLLYRVVAQPDPKLDLHVKPGTAEFPKAANPGEFAAAVRARLTDDKRLLRVFGSDVVLGRLTGGGKRARLQLINYSGRAVEGLRVRVLGGWKKAALQVYPAGRVAPEDLAAEAGAIEFSIPSLALYAVADLE